MINNNAYSKMSMRIICPVSINLREKSEAISYKSWYIFNANKISVEIKIMMRDIRVEDAKITSE